MDTIETNKPNINNAFEKAKKTYGLTDRELDVLKEVFLGKNNTQIAESLFISESTVKTHIHNLLNKMGAESRVGALYKVFVNYFDDFK